MVLRLCARLHHRGVLYIIVLFLVWLCEALSLAAKFCTFNAVFIFFVEILQGSARHKTEELRGNTKTAPAV